MKKKSNMNVIKMCNLALTFHKRLKESIEFAPTISLAKILVNSLRDQMEIKILVH